MKLNTKYIICTLIMAFLTSGCYNSKKDQRKTRLVPISEQEAFSTIDVFRGKTRIGRGLWGIIYWKDNKFVYLIQGKTKQWYQNTKFYIWKLADADPDTFKEITATHGGLWGRDRKNVYFFEHKLDDADVNSFQVIDSYGEEGYARDKNSVYYRYLKISDADPHTFRIIKRGRFSQDKNHTYAITNMYNTYGIKIIKDIDLETFQELYANYSKDKNHVYYDGYIINKADAKTFEIITTSDNSITEYAWDKNHVYFKGKILGDLDPSDIKEEIWVLAAIGMHDGMELELHEPINEKGTWHLTISKGPVFIDLLIDGEERIRDIKKYIDTTYNNPYYPDEEISLGHYHYRSKDIPCIEIGKFGEICFRLLIDREFENRYFIEGYDESTSTSIIFTLDEENLKSFVNAINELVDELENK